jgi:Protein of unknown function (DUF1350)
MSGSSSHAVVQCPDCVKRSHDDATTARMQIMSRQRGSSSAVVCGALFRVSAPRRQQRRRRRILDYYGWWLCAFALPLLCHWHERMVASAVAAAFVTPSCRSVHGQQHRPAPQRRQAVVAQVDSYQRRRGHASHSRMKAATDDGENDDTTVYSDALRTSREDSNETTTTSATIPSTTSSPRMRTVSVASRPYWQDDELPRKSDSSSDRFPSFSTVAATTESNEMLEWEKCVVDHEDASSSTCWVLLPPPSVALPSAIVHFCGGTVTGSAPHVWYHALLSDLVRHCNCAIVASTIPVTVAQSPLNHVRLATIVQRQFSTAYQTILMDEYYDYQADARSGNDPRPSRQSLLDLVPICGLGHSLGARLLMVLATLQGSVDSSALPSLTAPIPYKAMILMSFTNYGAGAGIPGLAPLFRKSRTIQERQEQERSRNRDDKPRSRNRNRDYYDDDDDYGRDEERDLMNELWKELTGTIQKGAARVQSTLTPAAESLEFHPKPEELWQAIERNRRYTIPHTLLVQFDNDDVDQSSRLAVAILKAYDALENNVQHSVKFARLRGTHLTPIALSSTQSNSRQGWIQKINTRAGRLLLKLLQNRRQQVRSQTEALLELRQSIVRYIIEVVGKS